MSDEKMYTVNFNMSVSGADGSPFMPAFGGTYVMPYEVMAHMQHVMLEALTKLNEEGVAARKAGRGA